MKLFSAISDGVDWSYGVKLMLIVAAAVLLCVVVALLVAEIAGKRRRRVIHENAEPQVDEETEEQPEPPAEQPEVEEQAVLAAEVAAAEAEPEPEPEPQPEPIPVEEYKPDEEIELTEDAVLVDDGEETGRVVVGATQFKVRYNTSFTAKLIQSDDVLKGRYSELKNELMRYSLKPRMSWPNESFYKGRVTYAKFAIRGKTLSLYLALEPSEYADTKYKFEDAGEVAKYAKTPMRLKLKSDRSVRWAKELIAQLAVKSGLERTEKEEEAFRPEYEETAPLVARKLIKLYYAGERIYIEPEPEPVELPVPSEAPEPVPELEIIEPEEELQPEPVLVPAEPAEEFEPELAELPVPSEAPEPVPELEIIEPEEELQPEPVLVPAEPAEEAEPELLITDEPEEEASVSEEPEEEAEEEAVEELPEPQRKEVAPVAGKPYRHKKKSKPRSYNCKIISTGKLNASFEDGDEVTLAKLIEKNIFPNQIIFYKVLFVGEVTKALTVVANEFSNEAKEAIENAGGKAIKFSETL